MLTRAYFEAMKEQELREQVLKPLLITMGYQDVFVNHGGAGEEGKDLVFWSADASGVRTNCAVVAKAGPVRGRIAIDKGTTGEVFGQINQCFGTPFLDKITGVEQHVHEVWVISNHPMSREFRTTIIAALKGRGSERYVKWFDGDTLWELIEKYQSIQAILNRVAEASKALNDLSPYYRAEVTATETGHSITVTPRHPDATIQQPLNWAGTLRFGDTPEDRAAQEAFERAIKTGAPVTIPGANIVQFEVPELLRQMMVQDDLPLKSLEMSSLPDKRCVPLSLHFLCVDGDNFVLPYIGLSVARAGTEEMTLTNDDQPIPFLITIIVNFPAQHADLNIALRDGPFNAHQLAVITHFRRCWSKPLALQVVNLDTGLVMFQMRREQAVGDLPQPCHAAIIDDLAAIQRRIKQTIFIPERALTTEEEEMLSKVRAILHQGWISGTWSGQAQSLPARAVPEYLGAFSGGKTVPLVVTGVDHAVLFGVRFALGPVKFTFHEPHLENEAEARAAYAHRVSDDDPIELRFVPGANKQVTIEYAEWSPAGQLQTGEPVSDAVASTRGAESNDESERSSP